MNIYINSNWLDFVDKYLDSRKLVGYNFLD